MRKLFIVTIMAMSLTLQAQLERPKWEFGGGLRLNYMNLDGGFSGYRGSDGYTFDVDYEQIGMSTYSSSLAIALGGRYKKWNLEFGGSRGSYAGGFTAKNDIVRDDMQIDSGALVDGSVDMAMYFLGTAFSIIQKKHDLGAGIGFLALNMGSDYHTTTTAGDVIRLGDSYWFPMPFLQIMGRLNFNRVKVNGTVGGAVFQGNKNGDDYDVGYYYIDANVAYEFLKTKKVTYTADLGYRNLFMNMEIENTSGWYHEKDIYQGPYVSVKAKIFSHEMWNPKQKNSQ